jgi:CRISPR-associated endonuclease/helicase Cas3
MPCPWASFVQRCGRAGRNATYDACDVYLLDIQGLNPLPYDPPDIQEFWKCFDQLSNVNIATLLEITPPRQQIKGDMLKSGTLLGLFDSHPQKDSSCDDISGYIRSKTDETLSVMWRDFEGEPDQSWRFRQDELCRITKERFYKFYSQPVWVWDDRQESWVKLDKPATNHIVLLPQSAGGYNSQLGFTGNSNDIPPILPENIRGKSERERYGKTNFVTLKQHSIDAHSELQKIADKLQHIDLDGHWNLIAECAQWHDLGKAHPQFQNAINSPEQEFWAKSPRENFKKYRRVGFRHELASAIGAIVHGKSFLFAYIVAAHHGKVRCNIENFYWLKDEKPLRGLINGDKVPACSLGNNSGDQIPEFVIDLSIHTDWKRNVDNEIEELGVFKLSYLETLVRIADRRASILREIKNQ